MTKVTIKWGGQKDWDDCLVYFSEEYCKLFASERKAVCQLLVILKEEKYLILPIIIEEISKGVKEAYSAHGYGGLIGDSCLNEEDIKVLKKFLSNHGIISLFIRHSPFLKNEQKIPKKYLELNRYTYLVKLRKYENLNHYLETLPQKNRWSINYAIRSDLTVSIDSFDDIDQRLIKKFYSIYRILMMNKNAEKEYLFSEEMFINHMKELRHKCEMISIKDGASEDLIAAAYFLLDKDGGVHYHLSACNEIAYSKQAMDLLMGSAIFHYGQESYKFLHLGGGLRIDESDGLSKFKKKYSTKVLKYFCTKIISDEVKYKSERAKRTINMPSYFLIADASR